MSGRVDVVVRVRSDSGEFLFFRRGIVIGGKAFAGYFIDFT